MDMVHDFLTNMYTKRADFVFTVTRDFVRACQTPILVLPDDVPAHPYAVAMETVRLAPKAEVSIYPWKASKDQIPQAVPGARLPPGASPRDRCPLRPAVWRRSAASRFPQARGRTVRDWGNAAGVHGVRVLHGSKTQQSPSRCVRCPRRKKVSGWHSRTMRTPCRSRAMPDKTSGCMERQIWPIPIEIKWSISYAMARVKTMSLLSFNLHTLH